MSLHTKLEFYNAVSLVVLSSKQSAESEKRRSIRYLMVRKRGCLDTSVKNH